MRIFSTNNYSKNQIYPKKKYSYSNVKFEAKSTLNKKATSKLENFFKGPFYYILTGVLTIFALKNVYKEMITQTESNNQPKEMIKEESKLVKKNDNKNIIDKCYFINYEKLYKKSLEKKEGIIF